MSSVVQPISTNQLPSWTANSAEREQWYAVHTKARHEKRIAARLGGKGFVVFLPAVTQVHQWSDRRQRIELPLFPSYLFLRIGSLSEVRLLFFQTPGVIGLVGDHGKGIPIPDYQIEEIKHLLERKVPFAEHPFLKVGQRVRVVGGPLDGIEGILVAGNGRRRLVISVNTIERSLAISVEGYEVRPV